MNYPTITLQYIVSSLIRSDDEMIGQSAHLNGKIVYLRKKVLLNMISTVMYFYACYRSDF